MTLNSAAGTVWDMLDVAEAVGEHKRERKVLALN